MRLSRKGLLPQGRSFSTPGRTVKYRHDSQPAAPEELGFSCSPFSVFARDSPGRPVIPSLSIRSIPCRIASSLLPQGLILKFSQQPTSYLSLSLSGALFLFLLLPARQDPPPSSLTHLALLRISYLLILFYLPNNFSINSFVDFNWDPKYKKKKREKEKEKKEKS